MGWFHPDWKYREQITITNNVATDYYNPEVLITVDHDDLVTATKSSADADDVIFTDESGEHQLAHWIESGENTSSCRIWVRAPRLRASAEETIYMYYGNSNATNSNDGAGVFTFFDDFEDLDDLIWSTSELGDYSVSGSRLRINVGATRAGLPVNMNEAPGYIVESKLQYLETGSTSSGTLTVTSAFYPQSGNAGANAVTLFMRNSTSTSVDMWGGTGSAASYNIVNGATGFTAANTTDYILGTIIRTDGLVFQNNYSTLQTYNSVSWDENINTIVLGRFDGNIASNIHDTSYDWVRVRQYISTVPTIGFGSEEPYVDMRQTYGLAVSRPGVDVGDADERDLIYSTKYQSPQPIMGLWIPARGKKAHDINTPMAFYEDAKREFFPKIAVDKNFIYNLSDEDTFVYLFHINLE